MLIKFLIAVALISLSVAVRKNFESNEIAKLIPM